MCTNFVLIEGVIRAHGMCDSALRIIYRSVIIAKLLYASSAWWGFASAMDKQRINAFLRRGLRSGLCPMDVSTFEELIDSQDEQLFDAILANQNHVLHQLLPPLSNASQRYILRPRAHNRQLPDYSSYLCQFNFINRLLYKNSY